MYSREEGTGEEEDLRWHARGCSRYKELSHLRGQQHVAACRVHHNRVKLQTDLEAADARVEYSCAAACGQIEGVLPIDAWLGGEEELGGDDCSAACVEH